MNIFGGDIHEEIDRIQNEAKAGRDFERDIRTIVEVFMETRPGEGGSDIYPNEQLRVVFDGLQALFDYLKVSDRGIDTPGRMQKRINDMIDRQGE